MKKILLIAGGIVLVLILILGFYISLGLAPVSSETKTTNFVIKKGEGIADVAQKLQDNHLIKNKYSFIAYAVITGQNKKIPSGTFRLSPSLSVKEIFINTLLTMNFHNDKISHIRLAFANFFLATKLAGANLLFQH